jgi:hypothetical protein
MDLAVLDMVIFSRLFFFLFFLSFFFLLVLNQNAPLPDSALVKCVSMDALGRTFRRIGPSSMESARVLHQLSDAGVVCVPDWQEAVVYPPSALHLLAWRLYREGMDRQQQGQHRANVNAKLAAWLSLAANLDLSIHLWL